MGLNLNKPIGKSKKDELQELMNKPLDQMNEDQIIKRGLKTKAKTDTLCYLGIAILFVLIIIPPIFSVVFDYTRPKDTHEEVVYARLNCTKWSNKILVGTDGKLYSGSKVVLTGGSNASSTVSITPSTTNVYSMTTQIILLQTVKPLL